MRDGSRRRTRPALLLFAILTAALSLLDWPALALAHAGLVSSTPAANAVLEQPPTQLVLHFSEPPELKLSEVKVLDRTGKRSDAAGAPTVDPSDASSLIVPMQPLDKGIYTVAYRVTSTIDGHVTGGSFAVVGTDIVKPGQLQAMYGDFSANNYQADPSLTVAHWLDYLAIAVLVGGIAFYPAVLRPALPRAGAPRAGSPSGRTALSLVADVELALPYSTLYLAWALAMMAAIGGAVLQAAASADTDLAGALGAPLSNLLQGTRYGALLWLRVTILAGMGGCLAIGQSLSPRRPLPWWWLGGALALGAALLLATSAGSHAAGTNEPALSLLADWLHLAAVCLWGGGLVMLTLSLRTARRLPGVASTDLVDRLAAGFTRLAGLSVLVIVATGIYRATFEVADPNNLLDTAYGLALAAKLSLLAPLLGLAGLNLLLIRRRLAGPHAGKWSTRLLWAVGSEMALVAGILGATALLTGLQPAREAFGAGIVLRAQADGIETILAVTPGRLGDNTFELYLRDSLHRPLDGADKVALLLTPPDSSLGTTEVVLAGRGNGRYSGEGKYLSLPGDWQIQALVRLPGREDIRVTYSLSPKPPP